MTLISWSGTMFEYLMPNLVMPVYSGSLLDQTCAAAVTTGRFGGGSMKAQPVLVVASRWMKE